MAIRRNFAEIVPFRKFHTTKFGEISLFYAEAPVVSRILLNTGDAWEEMEKSSYQLF